MANSHIIVRGRMQPVIFLFLALLVLPLQARENPYDVVGKALVPLAKVLIAGAQSHAVSATLVLESATNLPPASASETLELAMQSPDKVRLHAIVMGETVTITRSGQEIWAFPGAKIDALINGQNLPKPEADYKLDQFRLPVTEKQLVFLPVLFQVADAGDEAVNGENCRVLDVVLMPDLAKAIKAQDWSARIWVKADYKLAKIELRRLDAWKAVILVKKLEYTPTLPAETWQPAPEEAGDVLKLTPVRYKQLLDALTAKWAAFKMTNHQ